MTPLTPIIDINDLYYNANRLSQTLKQIPMFYKALNNMRDS